MNYYISLYVGAKRLVFHLRPRDGHVTIVSGCLILTAVNLIVLIRMAYITKRLVKLCKIYCDIWHRLTWSVCTGGRAGVRYVITKFSRMDSLPNFLTHGAPLRYEIWRNGPRPRFFSLTLTKKYCQTRHRVLQNTEAKKRFESIASGSSFEPRQFSLSSGVFVGLFELDRVQRWIECYFDSTTQHQQTKRNGK